MRTYGFLIIRPGKTVSVLPKWATSELAHQAAVDTQPQSCDSIIIVENRADEVKEFLASIGESSSWLTGTRFAPISQING